MKVLVVVEDPTHDQYIVKPIIEALLDSAGKRARVEVLKDPHLGGVEDVFTHLDEIVEDNPMIDLFIFALDRDCVHGREGRLRTRLAAHSKAMGCLAREEVEVWMLALWPKAQLEQFAGPWSEIRAECHPKERYAEPFLRALGYSSADLGYGRKRAMTALSGNIRRLLSRCKELDQLKAELAAL